MCFASYELAVFGQMEAGLGLLPGAGGVTPYTALRTPARDGGGSSGDDYDPELAAQYG
jgi:enoyl-CoA hydratase/carnithine racemase